MNIFVAGATGVLGSRTVAGLVEAGHSVTGVARSPDKAELLRSLGATPATVDLFDPGALATAIEGSDAVCNLATHIPRMSRAGLPGAWKENDRIRTEGARNLVDAALATGAQRYVQESISFLYEDSGDRWLDESAPLDAAPYVSSVLAAQETTERFAAAGGAGVVLRFGNFYGADAHHTQDLFRAAHKGESLEVGELDAYKSMLHLDDAAAAVVAALGLPSGVYNVCEDEPLTRGDHIEVVADLVGRKSLRRTMHRARRLGGSKVGLLARSQRVSNRAFRDATGWAPAYPSIREGYPAVFHDLEPAAT
jgi:nucleoside-diphosphate-sugar epimerase